MVYQSLMAENSPDYFDEEKLRENAITSIKHGIQDFYRASLFYQRVKELPPDDFAYTPFHDNYEEVGEPDSSRSISAIRNFSAGVLLLLKYRISKSFKNRDDKIFSIFNSKTATEINDDRGFYVKVFYKQTTIDTDGIKKMLSRLNINFDTKALTELIDVRNNVEHLHPKDNYANISSVLASMFSPLEDFINLELNESPEGILGIEWRMMLTHKDFYNATRSKIERKWKSIVFDNGLQGFRENPLKNCPICTIGFISPSHPKILSGDNKISASQYCDEINCTCTECDISLTLKELSEVLFSSFHGMYFQDKDGKHKEEIIEICEKCGTNAFSKTSKKCMWCSHCTNS